MSDGIEDAPSAAADLSAGQAAHLLASVTDDQAVTRRMAMPPRWFVGSASVLVAATVACNAISVDWLHVVAIVVVLACLLVVLVARHRRATAKPRWFAVLRPLRRSALAWFALWALVVVYEVVIFVPRWYAAVPWAGWVVAGVILGAALYIVATLTWRRWAMAADDAG